MKNWASPTNIWNIDGLNQIQMSRERDIFISYRRELHRNPEVSGQEYKTQQRILNWLENFSPDRIEKIGGTGVFALYDSGKEGETTWIRGDIDALPIFEENDFAYVSETPGVSHKCGHDGHTVVLLRLAQYLNETRPLSGKVGLLFQPAEENGEGAFAVIKDMEQRAYQPDRIFALHNIPGVALGKILLKPGAFTASVNSMNIYLKGFTSHAAEPEQGLSPANAIAKIIQKSQALQVPDMRDKDFSILAFVEIQMGEEAYGISAGEGLMRITYRAWELERLQMFESELKAMIEGVAQEENLKVRFEYTQFFESNVNEKSCLEMIEAAALSLDYPVHYLPFPFRFGEDFGRFTQRYRGAMFGLGAGESLAALHHPLYDFPDELIEKGASLFFRILQPIHYAT
jgi:amidohydrolase